MNLANVAAFLNGSGAHVCARVILGASLGWLLAGAAALAGRRASADFRHRAWCVGVAVAVCMPLVVAFAPAHVLRLVDLAPRAVAAPEGGLPLQVGPSAAASMPGANVADFSARENEPAAAPFVALPATPNAGAAPIEAAGVSTATVPAVAGDLAILLFAVWLGPAAGVLARLAWSMCMMRKVVRMATRVVDATALRELRTLAPRLRLRRLPRLLASDAIASPCCAGVWFASIVLPPAWRQWSASELRLVLMHELAHAMRRDVAWQALARLACAAYWFHPLAWIAAWRMRVEREAACDDCVLNAGESPTAYARRLWDLASATSDRRARLAAAVSMASPGSLERRVSAILDERQRRQPTTARMRAYLALSAASLLALAGLLTPFSTAAEGDEASPGAEVAKISPDQPGVHCQAIDEDGNPIANARVVRRWMRKDIPDTKTDANGQFFVDLFGRELMGLTLVVHDEQGGRMGMLDLSDQPSAGERLIERKVVLLPVRDVPIVVRDGEGRGVAGAQVQANAQGIAVATAISDEAGKAIIRVAEGIHFGPLVAFKDEQGLDYAPFPDLSNPVEPVVFLLDGFQPTSVRVADRQGEPLTGARIFLLGLRRPGRVDALDHTDMTAVRFVTDERGVVRLGFLPADVATGIRLIAMHENFMLSDATLKLGAETVVQLDPIVRVAGRVVFADGRPAPNAQILEAGRNSDRASMADARADAAGRFEIDVQRNTYCLLVAEHGREVSPGTSIVVREDPPDEVTLVLGPATRLHGRVTWNGQPAPDESVYIYLHLPGEYATLPVKERFPGSSNPASIDPMLWRSARTGADGGFEFFVGPGQYQTLCGSAKEQEVPVADEREIEIDLPLQRPSRPRVRGRIVLKDDSKQPVAKANVQTMGGDHVVSDAEGRFELNGLRGKMIVKASTVDQKLAALITVAESDAEVIVSMAPTASARGTLVDLDGQPIADSEIVIIFQIDGSFRTWSPALMGKVKTDDEGRFDIPGLVVRQKYQFHLVLERDADGHPMSFDLLREVHVREAKVYDLQTIAYKLARPAEPSK